MFTFLPGFVVAIGAHGEDVPFFIMAALGVILAVVAIVLTKRIPVNTRGARRLLAMGGLWLSRASLLVGIPTITVLLARIAFLAR
jgi:hypothetical protein